MVEFDDIANLLQEARMSKSRYSRSIAADLAISHQSSFDSVNDMSLEASSANDSMEGRTWL